MDVPPGYNPAVSMLQGGQDRPILPVQGGGGGMDVPPGYNYTASLLKGGIDQPIVGIQGGGAFTPSVPQTTGDIQRIPAFGRSFSIRIPNAETKADWKQLQFTKEEADFLNQIEPGDFVGMFASRKEAGETIAVFLENVVEGRCTEFTPYQLSSNCFKTREFQRNLRNKKQNPRITVPVALNGKSVSSNRMATNTNELQSVSELVPIPANEAPLPSNSELVDIKKAPLTRKLFRNAPSADPVSDAQTAVQTAETALTNAKQTLQTLNAQRFLVRPTYLREDVTGTQVPIYFNTKDKKFFGNIRKGAKFYRIKANATNDLKDKITNNKISEIDKAEAAVTEAQKKLQEAKLSLSTVESVKKKQDVAITKAKAAAAAASAKAEALQSAAPQKIAAAAAAKPTATQRFKSFFTRSKGGRKRTRKSNRTRKANRKNRR
jgi:hypothetical protein